MSYKKIVSSIWCHMDNFYLVKLFFEEKKKKIYATF